MYAELRLQEIAHSNITNSAENCAICYSEFSPKKPGIQLQQVVEKTGAVCGHFFHKACLKQWIQESSTCPVCRRDVNVEIWHRIIW